MTADTTVAPVKVAQFVTGYCDVAFQDPDHIITVAKRKLRGVDFDTIVGTGFSGGLIVPMLARAMDRNFVLIRKPRDNSHHSGHMVGLLGERWIFVDDFIASGSTLRRVKRIVKAQAQARYHETSYVGSYCYRGAFGNEPAFSPAAGEGR